MTRWVLDLEASQDDLHRVVADLRPPARAYSTGSRSLGLAGPLTSLFSFVPPQFVTERLGRLPVVFRDLLPPGSTWLHALDEPDGRWRVQIVGLADGMVPARTALGELVPAGGVLVTLREGHSGEDSEEDSDEDSEELGMFVDPARGDGVRLRVRGLPTWVGLPDARTTVLRCRASFHGTAATVTVESADLSVLS